MCPVTIKIAEKILGTVPEHYGTYSYTKTNKPEGGEND
jgi:hypothetical protein